ncbi:S24 family peptidase [Legionella sp. CNM-1927-20]|uniref:S24 family peptidase n=1 Tax=Legionella sp. CNM-1927-20 TaxID=3422221 RepID=UPI00403ABF6E
MSKETDINKIGINLNRNLSKLMDDNHISLSVLHRNTGIAIPTIKRLQTDPTTNPTITTLLPIANFFGITISHLISNQLPTGIIGYVENKDYWIKVPLIEWNQIIDWLKPENQIKVNSYVLVDIDVGRNDFALKVEDNDWPTISKGSILIINTELTPAHKDYAIVYRKEQLKPILKQVLVDEERIYLQSNNPHFQPTLFDESYHFIGVLMQIRKDTKV